MNKITCLNERIFQFIVSVGYFFGSSINWIKELVYISMMEMTVKQVLVIAVVIMNHLAMVLLRFVSRSIIKTKAFLQVKIVT